MTMTDSEPTTVDSVDDASVTDPADVRAEAEFTGSVLIQLFDENGNLKDERRGGGA